MGRSSTLPICCALQFCKCNNSIWPTENLTGGLRENPLKVLVHTCFSAPRCEFLVVPPTRLADE